MVWSDKSKFEKGHTGLAALFFLQMMASGMWLVPLGRILAAGGFSHLIPYAYASTAVAAFISPLMFGAMADRHASPVLVLRGLALASAAALALASWSIGKQMPATIVFSFIQLYALCSVPTNSLASTIVLSGLSDSQRQFGPIRAVGTFGWMCGCWLLSALAVDASPLAGYVAAAGWIGLALFTATLPMVPPPPAGELTLGQRMGWDALALLKNRDHRVVFITGALFSIPLAAFYPFTPPHLQHLGFQRTSAWMSLGQVTELMAMFTLAGLLGRYRLKWIFTAGLSVGVLRYVFCSLDRRFWLLAGVTLHGLSFTLFYITAQIYLNERIEAAWRARAQALMSLMNSGVGNLLGYLGTGYWFEFCRGSNGLRWPLFWGGLAAVIAVVLLFMLVGYHGVGMGLRKSPRVSSPANRC